ncbi:type VI secretion protein [Streptococcus suis]|uniref:VirB4-like conjugal transfer ATPase, CD1110 family n=1 Tax=Streptococcus suis TaxID=1307 RepID=UPI002A7AEEDD|nr:type VI secretion protein [Streptococcus suis]HEL2282442.1 type VI secretion protein [Streptococcus suis]HEL2292373.1 type VI secretion protein [Streptococcus suis]
MRKRQNPLTKSKLSATDKKRQKELRQELQPTTVNTIAYQGLFENGLMQVTPDYYSQSYLLGDVNYQTVGLEERALIVDKYSDMINALDDRTHFQLTLFNQRVNLNKFRSSVLYPLHGDGYNHFREELNQMMNQNLENGENNFNTLKLITFGKSDSSVKQAHRSLSQVGEYVKNGLAEIDCTFNRLEGEKRVNLLADMLRGDNHLPFSYKDLALSGLTTKHFIAPQSMSFKHKDYLTIDERYLQVVYVRDYGTELGDGFIRDLMQADRELIISFHVKGSQKSEAMTKVRTKKTLMESQKIGEQQKMARSGIYLEKASHVLETTIDEADDLLNTMTKTGDKLFETVFLIGLLEDSPEALKEALNDMRQVAGSHDLIIEPLPYMQEAAFNSLLPLGKNFLKGISRSLLTSNIAVQSPWTSVDLQDKGGKYYGINQISNNIITIDRKALNTPSGLILGTSGSGKGMGTKHEITTTRLKEVDDKTEIIVVDPENEVRQEVVL